MDETSDSQCIKAAEDIEEKEGAPKVINVETPIRTSPNIQDRGNDTEDKENANANKEGEIKVTVSCLFCTNSANNYMLRCSKCCGYVHFKCSFLPAYQIFNYCNSIRKYICKSCTSDKHEMLIEECNKGVNEAKNLEIDELKRLIEMKNIEIQELKVNIELQNKEAEHLRDENQKKNNLLKSEQTSRNHIIQEQAEQYSKLEKDFVTCKKNLAEKTKELNLLKKKDSQHSSVITAENETQIMIQLKEEIKFLKNEVEIQKTLNNQAKKTCEIYDRLLEAKEQIIQNQKQQRTENKRDSENKSNTGKVCFNFQRGHCNNDNCSFNHPSETCKFYKKSGRCNRGFRCRFAHAITKESNKILNKEQSTNRFEPLQQEERQSVEENHRNENNSNEDNHCTPPQETKITNNNRRPNVCITENYIQNYKQITYPGNSNYATIAKSGKKIFVIGDSHVKRIRRDDFNKQLKSGKAFFRSFSGANAKQIQHYIIPTLTDDQPDAIIIHAGTNDIINNNSNEDKIAKDIVNIVETCKGAGINDIFVSSLLVKKNPRLTAVIHRVNDLLRDYCATNGIHFINNDNVTTEHLWKDGIHLQDIGTTILSKNFYEYINYIFYERNIRYYNN